MSCHQNSVSSGEIRMEEAVDANTERIDTHK